MQECRITYVYTHSAGKINLAQSLSPPWLQLVEVELYTYREGILFSMEKKSFVCIH